MRSIRQANASLKPSGRKKPRDFHNEKAGIFPALRYRSFLSETLFAEMFLQKRPLERILL
jgi:hypothetical protein